MNTIFEIGEKVVLDKDLTTQSIVTVVNGKPAAGIAGLFTLVKDENGNKWEVMTYRLSRL